MMKKSEHKYLSGFTLLEVMISVIIFAGITLGLFFTFSEISAYFSKETYIEDVNHYGNTVLDDLNSTLMKAKKITLTSRNGFRVLEVVSPDDKKDVFSAEDDKGILRNGESFVPFKSFKTDIAEYTVTEFWVETLPAADGAYSPALAKIRRSMFVVTFEVLLNAHRKKIDTEQAFRFSRTVFAANYYLNI